MQRLFLFLALQSYAFSTEFLIINGGSDPVGHHEVFNTNVQTEFNHFTSRQKGAKPIVLNAGGEGSPYVPTDEGYSIRENDGRLRLSPTRFPFSVRPATLTDIQSAFTEIKSRNPKDVTVYFGDHGGSGFVCTWANTQLPGSEIRKWESSLPEDVVVRKIHSHCYAGSSMVDPARKVPSSRREWDEFLVKYYRKNSCGLAFSAHDELGESINWGKSVEDSQFTQFYKKNPAASLADLSGFLDEQTTKLPVHVLTSEYLIQDFAKFHCRTERKSNSTTRHGESMPEEIAASSESPLCAKFDSQYEELTKKVHQFDEAYHDIQRVMNLLVEKFMTEKYPEETRKRKELLARWTELRKEIQLLFPADTAEAKTKLASLESELDGLVKGDLAGSDNFHNSIRSHSLQKEDYEKFLATSEVKELLASESFKKAHPHFTLFRAKPEYQGKSEYQLWKAVTSLGDKAQRERKELWQSWRKNRRLAFEALMESPENKNIKETYESIRKCEMSPLA